MENCNWYSLRSDRKTNSTNDSSHRPTEHPAETQRSPLRPVCPREVLLLRIRVRAAVMDAAQLFRVQGGSIIR